MSFPLMANITIHSPLDGMIYSSSTVTFNATSHDSTGFYLVNHQLIPMTEFLSKELPLVVGNNKICIHLMDQDLRLVASSRRCLSVYRVHPFNSTMSLRYAKILTDLMVHHQLNFLKDGYLDLNDPIKKRDVYALAMWFYMQQRGPNMMDAKAEFLYSDMALYGHYLALYRFRPSLLPPPELGRFFPNAAMTRRDFLNLVLVIQGIPDQISTDYLIRDKWTIPRSLASIISNDWQDLQMFVTGVDVINVLDALFNYPQPLVSSNALVIPWESQPPHRLVSRLSGPADSMSRVSALSGIRKRTHQWMLSIQQLVMPKKMPKVSSNQSASTTPLVRRVVVESGDTIHKISRRVYGSSRSWQRLVDANQLTVTTVTTNGTAVVNVAIFPGQSLIVP